MLSFLFMLGCNCNNENYLNAMKNSDVAFEGIVIDIKDSSIIFNIINPIKGVKDTILEIINDRECPYQFYKDKIYRVFARMDGDKLITSKCMGDTQLDEDEDIRDYSE